MNTFIQGVKDKFSPRKSVKRQLLPGSSTSETEEQRGDPLGLDPNAASPPKAPTAGVVGRGKLSWAHLLAIPASGLRVMYEDATARVSAVQDGPCLIWSSQRVSER